MKQIFKVLINMMVVAMVLFCVQDEVFAFELTQEEQAWIDLHDDRTLHIGLAPYEGIDLFKVGDRTKAIYLILKDFLNKRQACPLQ